MARIIFLGTGGTSPVVSKQLRLSGGIVMQIEDLQFHIDPGPGSLIAARQAGVNLAHTTAVFVTHNHINHCNDLNVVIEALTHGGIEHRGILLASKSVLHTTENSHPFLTQHHQNLLEKIIVMEQKRKVGIELIEINALPVNHTDPTAVGFKFFCPKFTLSYSGDTAFSEEIIDNMSGSDVIILNVPFFSESKGKNLSVQDAITIVSKVQPQLCILTHFGLDMLKNDPLQAAREVQRITGVQTIAARDGLAVSPEGYKFPNPVKGM